MKKSKSKQIISIFVATSLGIAIGIAGSDEGAQFRGVPLFALCTVFAFLLNWIVYIHANLAKTEHYFDLTGSVTYLGVIVLALSLSEEMSNRAWIVSAMVVLWALRLGSFLYFRVKRVGADSRFDEIKLMPLRFFSVWTLQALWVVLTVACALVIVTGQNAQSINWVGDVGIAMWIVGMGFEIVADQQKSSFSKNPENAGRFISSGLWACSRHPNYFGEILLWTGIAVLAIPVLQGWQWCALISPVFVYVLIRHLSGVKGMEEKADQRWGSEPAYQVYRERTPLLIPRLPPRKS